MNFALILFVLCLATGALWAADAFYFRKRRAAGAPEPIWVEWGASFFPVILIVFFLRSFIVEPFKIPSGSMIPTLLVGDFILVNKFTYGIRIPVINKKVVAMNLPARGDVMVFRYPEDPSVDYIKRVVGLPGDTVSYRDRQLTINGKAVPLGAETDFLERLKVFSRHAEKLGDVEHMLIHDHGSPPDAQPKYAYPYLNKCQYNSGAISCEVPQGHYFVMGDNRDHSLDSRFWGFVPEENIVGKAFFVWFNSSFDFGRIGPFH